MQPFAVLLEIARGPARSRAWLKRNDEWLESAPGTFAAVFRAAITAPNFEAFLTEVPAHLPRDAWAPLRLFVATPEGARDEEWLRAVEQHVMRLSSAFETMGTATGRTSSSRPNVQNIGRGMRPGR